MRGHWYYATVLVGAVVLSGCQKPAGPPLEQPGSETTPRTEGLQPTAEQPKMEPKTESQPKPAENAAATAKPTATEGQSAQTFSATLSGSNEVPAVKTDAAGEAKFSIPSGKEQLHYEVTVHDLKDVTMAHLHMSPAGENGPIVVWLYPSPSEQKEKLIEGVTNGKLVEGTVTPADFVGPLKEKPFDDLVAKIKQGDIYVTVHTKQNPEGELRGKVE